MAGRETRNSRAAQEHLAWIEMNCNRMTPDRAASLRALLSSSNMLRGPHRHHVRGLPRAQTRTKGVRRRARPAGLAHWAALLSADDCRPCTPLPVRQTRACECDGTHRRFLIHLARRHHRRRLHGRLAPCAHSPRSYVWSTNSQSP